ncbi:MAG: tRNA uracil 4-sulfurtransferase ThiI [bacterium]
MATLKKQIVVIHYGELALKGKNRPFFENKLKSNIKKAISVEGSFEIKKLRGRFILYIQQSGNIKAIEEGLGNVFGISHFSFGVVAEKKIGALKEAAWRLLDEKEFDSFRIETRRSQKDFPLNSMETNKQVGSFVQEKCGKKVDLTNPDVCCYIEITEHEAFLYTEKIPGLRGLPVGVSEKAVCLLSSGIDSPVASYLMLKRGVHLIYAHFHSEPFTSRASQENTARLVQVLNRLQYSSKVYFIPFIDIQKEIMAKAPSALRVLLYRRYMVRLAERIAEIEKATALVTGENVGQVASQTLSNIRVVGEVTRLPILRPLAGHDKEEIVQLAKRIGTFAISTEPYEDCCSLFVPENPETKATPQALLEAEKLLEVAPLLDRAIDESEISVYCTEKIEK